MGEMRELVILEEDLRDHLTERLRLQGSSAQDVEKLGLPFLFASGSELLRTYILAQSEFTASLPDKYRLPQRGYVWYMFSQSVREIRVTSEGMVIKYELLDEYRLPFKQFYL
ncbi:MAG: hypothetical protein A4E45_01183 [Methanosaeta sp. PtaB.Bin039]|nr:MAG: hypothetical protein A4E45_01183 [Methanosaeta sp. PtaB.Bin039]OPY45519.1 MAG: hypothetical protein A4E47_00936 [Methanosaeta sp. PtaU1.Bin028]HOT07897.1 hypothetical protein [Methanotrichaceae archaeon]HQF17684.1 hypothetical protein [Methanotrichaceae archaeon]HQI92287.1 hypothetical protein [Methanotrichaceae archaeon]